MRSKFAAELAVDAREHVEVERGRHADRIVVGEQQPIDRLLEIGREQQPVARAPGAAAPGAGTRRPRRGRNCRSCPPRNSTNSDWLGLAARSDRARGRSRYSPRSRARGPRGCGRALAPPWRARCARCRSGSTRRAGATTAPPGSSACSCALPLPSSAISTSGVERRNDLGGVPLQQPLAGAREPVLGQQADRLEERRADLVVEVLGRQLLLAAGARARLAHVVREGETGRVLGWTERLGRARHRCPFDAAERGVHVRVVRLEPVAERRAAACTRRCATSRPSSRSAFRRRSWPSIPRRTGTR